MDRLVDIRKREMRMRDRPNILFLLTDQWRGDCLGASGHPAVDTPNLDMLARRGANFTRAYSSCPSCIAARASIFTGLSPSNHGRLGYQDQVPWTYPDMLASVFRRGGFQTHCVGKTHFYPQGAGCGFEAVESYEGDQGFDGFTSDYLRWLAERTKGQVTERDHGVDFNSWYARPSHLPEELHNTTWVATRGVEFLARRDPGRPFFLNLSFHRPHPPIDPPAVFWDMFRDRPLPPVPVGEWAAEHDVPVDNVNAWRGRVPDRFLGRARRGYYAQLAHIDNQIGRVLQALHKYGAGPTVICFTSDHGEMLGDHHLFRKTYAYEGSARVPLILHLPDRPAVRRDCAVPVVLEDLYPTLLAAAGLSAPDTVDGRSLLPIYDGAAGVDGRAFIQGEHSACYHADLGMFFLTDGRWKYIWYSRPGREQLFDLADDPDELRDLSRVATAETERWRGRLAGVLAERPQDGLSDGGRLIPGKNLPAVRPGVLARVGAAP